jgi:4-hydroxybenzoate polyprenyltransferase
MSATPETTATDIPEESWIDRFAPGFSQPFLRLARADRPIGTWLLVFPCWWSASLAAEHWPDPWLLALFGVGALILRGAGCTLNDIVDRNIDGRIARTATRPIPSGAVSVPGATAFLVLQLALGLAVLVQLNALTIALGAASLALVAVYPFMKRVTYWPQIVLGLTFNWGALLGWTAVTGHIGAPALVLYAGSILWTVGYDTIYAHQDKTDDLKLGIKSSALKLGVRTRPWLFVFYAGAAVLFALAGGLAEVSWPYYAGLAGVAIHFAWQAARLDIDDAADCGVKFRSNRFVGWILFGGIVAARVLA